MQVMLVLQHVNGNINKEIFNISFLCYNFYGDNMLSILIGIMPGIVFALLFYLLDKNKKDINILFLIGTFVFGAISSYLCYRLEWHFGSYFKKVAESNLFEVFFYAVFGVAIFEEGAKLFFSFLFGTFNKIKHLTNVVTYSVVTSCGFLAFENAVFYSMKYGISGSISRLYTSSPGHVCYGIIMGVILYNVFKIRKINLKSCLFLFISFLIPCLLHAFYNTFLYQGIQSLYIVSYIYLFILEIICVFIVYRVYFSKNK